MSPIEQAIEKLRALTSGSPLEGKLFLVGGLLRDRLLGLTPDLDVDIVCTSDALDAARFVTDAGASDHDPVVYPRFGTAMTSICGVPVEFASARRDSYESRSRKPSVEPATLEQDAYRRDFTINTLMENLHTGDMLDLTGMGLDDLRSRIIRTPLDAAATFSDDPLRMLRAVRFSARLGFDIHPDTMQGLLTSVDRLSIISNERIRDEFAKTAAHQSAPRGMDLLLATGLLARFAPELAAMKGVEQNRFHLYDVWEHTMKALDSLPPDAPLEVRLAVIFHDVGKPPTRTVGDDGEAHFYGHQTVGADMTAAILRRLKFPTSTIERVSSFVSKHMRIGEYKPEWSEGAVRRLARDLGDDIEDFFVISSADKAACNPEHHYLDNEVVRQRITNALAEVDYVHVPSPLNGHEIMQITGLGTCPIIGEIKEMLVAKVLEGELAPDDKERSASLALEYVEGHRGSES